MNFRILKYFITVAEELNFSRAAKRLNMAQPPLSQQIKQLESELEVQLFKRNNRMVQLTDAGQVFLVEARSILSQMEQSVRRTQLTAEGKFGELKVGFVGSATDGIFVEKIKDFHQQFPSVHLYLKELTSEEQLEALYSGKIDLGLMRPQVNNQTLQSLTVSEERLVLVLPDYHALASKRTVSVQDVATEPFIMFPRSLGPDFYDVIIGFFQHHHVSMYIVQEAIHMHTVVNLVSTGLGIAVVPSSVMNFNRSGIVYKEFAESTPVIGLSATWRKDNDSTVLHSFLNHLTGKQWRISPF